MDTKIADQAPSDLVRSRLYDALALVGVASVVGGLALVSIPVALVVFGCLAIAVAVLATIARDKKPT